MLDTIWKPAFTWKCIVCGCRLCRKRFVSLAAHGFRNTYINMRVDDVGSAYRTADLWKSKGTILTPNSNSDILVRNPETWSVVDVCSQCWKSCFCPELRNGRKRPLCPQTPVWLAPIHRPEPAAGAASAHECVCRGGGSKASVVGKTPLIISTDQRTAQFCYWTFTQRYTQSKEDGARIVASCVDVQYKCQTNTNIKRISSSLILQKENTYTDILLRPGSCRILLILLSWHVNCYQRLDMLTVPVAEFLAGFKLKGNLLPRQHLSPLADIVSVISSWAVDIWDGVCTTAVRQRHPVGTCE